MCSQMNETTRAVQRVSWDQRSGSIALGKRRKRLKGAWLKVQVNNRKMFDIQVRME